MTFYDPSKGGPSRAEVIEKNFERIARRMAMQMNVDLGKIPPLLGGGKGTKYTPEQQAALDQYINQG